MNVHKKSDHFPILGASLLQTSLQRDTRKNLVKQTRHHMTSLCFLTVPTLPIILLQIKMKPQHLVSFLLLTALAEAGAEDRTSTGVMWQAANARDGVRTTATEEISPGSELLCAVEASKRSWCTFYCYIDDVCRLYDIVFPPSIFPSTVNCKTNFPSRSGEYLASKFPHRAGVLNPFVPLYPLGIFIDSRVSLK